MSNYTTYLISSQKLKELSSVEVMEELYSHAPITSTPVKFPEIFYVKINVFEKDDTCGILYYNSLNDEDPFLIMGYSDIGFFITASLLKSVGTLIE